MDGLSIHEVHKQDASIMFKRFHYLGDKEFIHSIAYGLYKDSELIGIANFGSPSGISTMKGWFGRSNDDEVCIFNDVHALAKTHDTITYEITTALNPNIKKEIV